MSNANKVGSPKTQRVLTTEEDTALIERRKADVGDQVIERRKADVSDEDTAIILRKARLPGHRDPELEELSAPVSPGVDHRKHVRHPFQAPIVSIPILPDGRPDWDRQMSGVSNNISQGGVSMELAFNEDACQHKHVLIGVQDENHIFHFDGVEIQHVRAEDSGRMRVGCSFGGPVTDFLHPEKLKPKLDVHSMKFVEAYPQAIISEWMRVGILKQVLMDRVMLCPKCHALPTFRLACKKCYSARVTRDALMHHFACAHVDLVREFEIDHTTTCPKCRAKNLIVGADFEYLRGPYQCTDCCWSSSELEQIGHCVRCDYRFSADEAVQKDLFGYHVNRLDPLAFVPAP